MAIDSPPSDTSERTSQHAFSSSAWFPSSVVLFQGPRFMLVAFGPIAALAVVLGCYWVIARQIQAGLAPERYAHVLFLLLPLGIIAGSRLFSLALDLPGLIASPRDALRKRGFAFQGGLLGACAVIFTVTEWRALDPLIVADTFALGLPLGHAVGRLACLSYGCCHGRPTSMPWAIRYRSSHAKAVWEAGLKDVHIHPTQLYQAAGCLLHFALLAWLATRPQLRSGQLAFAYLGVGALGRIGLEHFRGEPTSRLFGFTPYQVFCFGQLAVSLALLLIVRGDSNPFLGRMPLGAALAQATEFLPLFALGFLPLALSFGVHGKKIGTL